MPTPVSLFEGESITFTQLYRDNFEALISLAKKKLRSQELAEDVIQELFITVMIKARKGEIAHVKDLKSYLFRSAWNRSSHKLLELERRFYATKEFVLTMERAEYPNDQSYNFEKAEQMLKKLPTQRRTAFELVKIQGLTEKAAGEKLSISPGTIHTHVKRAMHYLRKNCIPMPQ